MRISEFIERSNSAGSPEEVFALLEKVCSGFGIDQIAYGALTNHVIYNSQSYQPPAIVLNYPPDWVDHYFANSYQHMDPIVTLTPSLRRPYLWDRMAETLTLTGEQETFLAEAREAGLKDGMSVPLHGPFGNVAVLSLANQEGNPAIESFFGELNAVAAQFHTVYTDHALGIRQVPPSVSLTERERECLLWSARGKSSWDIGMIIGISEHTVNFHLKNAMAKLEAGSRVVAVVKAIRAGLISP